MRATKCVWLDIVDKNTNISQLLEGLPSNDCVYKKNIRASLTRMIHNNSEEPVVMLHFDNMDVAMVYVYEVCENIQLKKAVTQVRDKLHDILSNSSTEDLLEISYKIDKIISILVQ